MRTEERPDEKGADLPAPRLERYRLIRELGRGSSATVYLAKDEETGQSVSVKRFHPEMLRMAAASPRIRREMALGASLSHPHIVQVLRVLDQHDPPALILEYVDGDNLETFQSRLPYVLPELSVLIVIQILRALEYAHGQGIIHRDLKPENVLLDTEGKVRVTDFGLAKWWEGTAITRSNFLLGSIDYMSPEQARGDSVTFQSDVFSVGSILYFLTTGTRPFSRAGVLATLSAIRDESPEPPQRRNPKLSAELSRVMLRALAKEGSRRFASATEFREALERYLESLGLDSFVFDLASWRRDPSGIAIDALGIAAERLAARAEEALRARDWDAFVERLAHLAVKAPESAAAQRLTAQYRRRRRRSALSLSAAVVVLVALTGALLGWRAWRRTPAPPPPAVASAAAAVPAPASASPPVHARVRSRAVVHGSVRFELPRGVRVFWDGREVDPRKKIPRESLGMHRLRLVRAGFAPIFAQVEVKASEPTVIKVQ